MINESIYKNPYTFYNSKIHESTLEEITGREVDLIELEMCRFNEDIENACNSKD